MTDVALKEYLESRIDALRDEIHKAERTLGLRLEQMNEIREAMKDQQAHMATKDHVDMRTGNLEERLRSLETSRAYTMGIAAAVALVISLIGVFAGVLL